MPYIESGPVHDMDIPCVRMLAWVAPYTPTGNEPRRDNHEYRIEAFVQATKHMPRSMALDTETTGVWWRDTAFCFTAAWEGESHFIDLEALEQSSHKQAVLNVLSNVKYLIFHNAKFDIEKLIAAKLLLRADLTPDRIHDTQTQAHLLDEHRSKRLKDLARTELGLETDEEEALKKIRELGLKKEDGYLPIYRARPDILIPYALKDAEFTYALWVKFQKQLAAKGQALVNKYDKERALLLVILDIETAGMKVDIPYVEEQIKSYGTRIIQAKKEIQRISGRKVFEDSDLVPRRLDSPEYNKAGTKILRTYETQNAAKERAARESFNPNSPAQVIDLFSDFGIFLTTASKDAMDEVDHPLAAAILELRGLVKIRQTYLQAIRDEAVDGVLHGNFRTTGTVTGRFSSGKHEA